MMGGSLFPVSRLHFGSKGMLLYLFLHNRQIFLVLHLGWAAPIAADAAVALTY